MTLALRKIKSFQDKIEGFFHPDTRFAMWFASKGFSSNQRIRFYEKLSRLEANGVGLRDAVFDLKKRAEKHGKTGALAIVLYHIQQGLAEGRTFANSLEPFIPISETMVIQAGENSGRLNKSLLICVDIIEANQKMKSTMLTAVSYPAFLTLVMCGALYVIGRVAMPKILLKIDPLALTGASKALYLMSQFMQTNWIFVVFGAILILFMTVILSMPRWKGRLRVLFDKIPPWSIYRLVTGSGWLLSVSALVDSGVGILKSIEQINETVAKKNPWLSERLRPCIVAIKKGVTLGDALDLAGHGFPDQDIIDDLAVYEPLPEFESVLIKMGTKEIDSVLKRVDRQAGVLRWSLLGFFVVMVFGILYGVMGIMKQMTGASAF